MYLSSILPYAQSTWPADSAFGATLATHNGDHLITYHGVGFFPLGVSLTGFSTAIFLPLMLRINDFNVNSVSVLFLGGAGGHWVKPVSYVSTIDILFHN